LSQYGVAFISPPGGTIVGGSMSMKSKLAVLVLFGTLTMTLAGCGEDDTTDTANSTTSAADGTDGTDDTAGTTSAPASDDTSGPGDTTATTAGDGDAATADGAWVLDAAASSLTEVGDAVVTLTIDGDTAHGSSGCNSFSGAVTVDNTSVTFGDLATTRMACDEALMAAEAEFTAALAAVDTIEVADATLTLSNADGTTLVFTAVDPSAEILGEWSIVNYATTDAITGPVEGTEPSITFLDDGTLSLATGCNTIASSWTLDGDALTVDPPASTMMACEEAGIMDQEADLGAAIEGSASVEIAPGQLTILDADGNIVIIATQDA
jgi:heat shock protein HslJ